MAAAKATIDHDTIREWVERRGGHPAHVRATARGDDPGVLRIDFPGFSGESSLEKLSWDKFFEWFDNNELAFLYQEKKDSRFNKLVGRDSVELPKGAARAASGKQWAGAGRTNAVKFLEQQHRQVEALFRQFREADSAKEKQGTFLRIADLLAAHSKIEETVFYPSVLDPQTEDDLREAVEEHLMVKRLIADLLEMKPQDEQYDAKVSVLEEIVEHHVEEEEQQLFTTVCARDEQQLFALGEQLKSAYEQVLAEGPLSELPEETIAAARI